MDSNIIDIRNHLRNLSLKPTRELVSVELNMPLPLARRVLEVMEEYYDSNPTSAVAS